MIAAEFRRIFIDVMREHEYIETWSNNGQLAGLAGHRVKNGHPVAKTFWKAEIWVSGNCCQVYGLHNTGCKFKISADPKVTCLEIIKWLSEFERFNHLTSIIEKVENVG